MNRRLSKAVLLQFSGTVGAGIFILPYIFQHSNFLFSSLCLVFLGIAMVLLNLSYAHIVVHTQGDHQLSGYAHKYLGLNFKYLATFNVLFLGLGALIAYLHLSQSFILILLPGLNPTLAVSLFVSLVLIFHIDGFKPQESIINFLPYLAILIVASLFFVSLFLAPSVSTTAFPSIFVFGPLVFALSGFTIIPEIEEALRNSPNKKNELTQAIIIGVGLVVVVYLCFTFAVIRLSGQFLSIDSVTGIRNFSPILGKLIATFGLITLFRASLNFLFVFKEIFYRDFNFSRQQSYTLSSVSPFIAYVLAKVPYVSTLSFVGTTSTLVATILICTMLQKVKPKSSISALSAVIIFTFVLGFIFEVISINHR